MRRILVPMILAAGAFVLGANLTFADGAGDPAPVKTEGGKYYDKEGNPTFKVQSDGTVDWSTYSGPLSFGLPCLSRSRRRRIELRPGAQQLLEDQELFGLRQRCC